MRKTPRGSAPPKPGRGAGGEIGSRAAAPQPAGRRRHRPGEGAAQQHRHEGPPGAGPLQLRRRQPAPRLGHQRVVEELRNPSRHRPYPGTDHRRQQGDPQRMPHRPPAPAPEREGGGDEQRHHQGDRPLGEHAERHRRPGEQGPAEVVAGADARPRSLDGEIEGGQGDGDEQAQQAVEDDDAREGHRQGSAAGGDRRRPTGAAPEQPHGEPAGEHGGGQSGEKRRQPRRRLAGAQAVDRDRRRGEVEHRFVEVGEAVEVRQHVVAAGRHLASDLCVAPLVGVDQRDAAEPVGEPRRADHRPKRKQQGGRPRVGAREDGSGHRDALRRAWTSGWGGGRTAPSDRPETTRIAAAAADRPAASQSPSSRSATRSRRLRSVSRLRWPIRSKVMCCAPSRCAVSTG